MLSISPLVRISLGLVLLTLAVILSADMIFGITPDYRKPLLDSRKNSQRRSHYSSLRRCRTIRSQT